MILITGKSKSGSWEIRGQQLGECLAARVVRDADKSLIRAADVVVVVKRVSDELLQRLRGRRWVWDVVDAWPQPKGNEWPRERALRWLHGELHRMKPSAVVFPTQQMSADAGFDGPCLVLPHHAWPKYMDHVPVVRERVEVVGYEGGEHYLGRWRQAIDVECERRGWRFVINGDMRDADIGIALRDVDGYPAGAWKSNCKLANLQALGLPALLSPEEGYKDSSNGTELWLDHAGQLGDAFDRLESAEVRSEIAALQRKTAPRLAQVGEWYAQWLNQLSC